MREGMGPAPKPSRAIGRIGYWCWETMTPRVAGSYQAGSAAVDVALTAADLVLEGESIAYGLAPPGHHCPRAAFGGYGLFNYSAAAVEYLVQRSGGCVAVLDVDFVPKLGENAREWLRGVEGRPLDLRPTTD